jgi:hypothetical protein
MRLIWVATLMVEIVAMCRPIARHVAMKGLRGFSSRLMRGDSVPNSDPSEWVCQLELRFACHSFHCCRCFTGSTESIFWVL